MYRLLSWMFCILLVYEGTINHRLGYLIMGIIVSAILFVAVPELLALANEDTD